MRTLYLLRGHELVFRGHNWVFCGHKLVVRAHVIAILRPQVNFFFWPCHVWGSVYFLPTSEHKCMNFLLLTFWNWLVTLVWMLFIFGVSARNKDIKYIRRRKQAERESGMGRKVVLVSRICRDPAAPCLDFLKLGCFTNLKCVYLSSWEWDSTLNCLCGVFRNSWDKILLILSLILIVNELYFYDVHFRVCTLLLSPE